MLNRGLGLLAIAAAIAANTALFMRDVLPAWIAGDPPPPGASSLAVGYTRVSQTGIYDKAEKRLGTVWTKARRNKDFLTVDSTTVLDVIETGGETLTPKLRIDTSYTYANDFRLDRLTVDVKGFGLPIRLAGQFAPPNDFACEWRAADRTGRFIIPSDATRAMGDATRPFGDLSELHVGQTWRLELFDPLAAILPGFQGSSMDTQSVIVKVTGTQKLEHDGLSVLAYIVEADRMKAWVSPIGQVLRQEVSLPFLGTIVMLDEPYDDEARTELGGWIPGDDENVEGLE